MNKIKVKGKKYKIIESYQPKTGEIVYFIQKRSWVLWINLGDYGEFGRGRYNFKTIDEAIDFIKSGMKNPYDTIQRVIGYV